MGMDELTKQLERFKGNFHQQKTQFLADVGNTMIGHARPRTPVDTGLSRDSWGVEVTGNKVKVQNTANRGGNYYASFWNYGTSRQMGRFTLQIALNMTLQELPDLFDVTVHKAWENASE